jgi:hypothetical protein
MKQFVLLSLFLNVIISAKAQFPEHWIGTYSGKMSLLSTGKPADSVSVQLKIYEILKDSVWSYHMDFHHQTHGDMTKDYLIKKDKNGSFFTDENNGILIPMTYLDGCFYDCYEVDGMIFHSTMRLFWEDIFYELTGTSLRSGSERDIGNKEEGSYLVKSFKPAIIQKVLLKKN